MAAQTSTHILLIVAHSPVLGTQSWATSHRSHDPVILPCLLGCRARKAPDVQFFSPLTGSRQDSEELDSPKDSPKLDFWAPRRSRFLGSENLDLIWAHVPAWSRPSRVVLYAPILENACL